MLTKGRATVFVKFSLTDLYLPTVMDCAMPETDEHLLSEFIEQQ